MLRERLLVITDRRLVPGGALAEHLAAMLDGMPTEFVLVQLREKDLLGRELFSLAATVREVTARHGVRMLVNSRLDVALAVGADGVHLPEDGIPVAAARALLGPRLLVGASAHGAARAKELRAAGADLVTLGPVWATPSKAAYGPPLGLGPITAAGSAFALGGVDSPARAAAAVTGGAVGVAVMRTLMTALDPAITARGLLDAIETPESLDLTHAMRQSSSRF